MGAIRIDGVQYESNQGPSAQPEDVLLRHRGYRVCLFFWFFFLKPSFGCHPEEVGRSNGGLPGRRTCRVMELEIVHGPRAMRADLYRGALPDFACIFLFAYCTLPRDGDFRRCVMRGLHRFAIIRRGSLSLWPFHDFQPQLLFFFIVAFHQTPTPSSRWSNETPTPMAERAKMTKILTRLAVSVVPYGSQMTTLGRE